MRDLPSKDAQLKVICAWLIKFGARRPSEAAMEVTSYSGNKRRRFFRALRDCGCIARTSNGWEPIKDSLAEGEAR